MILGTQSKNHGQTNSNLNRVYDRMELYEDINENGIKQAEELREKIKEMNFDIIYCSPLLRARHTVAFYVYFKGIPENGKVLKLGLQNGEIKEYEL